MRTERQGSTLSGQLPALIVRVTLIDYHVVMSKRSATPVRFDVPVAERLASFVAANPGMSLSSAANRLVDEALRTSEHPGITFRPGPTGRRAGLASGPDVWEVVRAVRSARIAAPVCSGLVSSCAARSPESGVVKLYAGIMRYP